MVCTRFSTALLVAGLRHPVQCADRIERQRVERSASGFAEKFVQHSLLRERAARGLKLECCAAVVPALCPGDAVGVARCIHHQGGDRQLAVVLGAAEVVNHMIGPGAVAVGRQLEGRAAAPTATLVATGRISAIEVALRISTQRSYGSGFVGQVGIGPALGAGRQLSDPAGADRAVEVVGLAEE
jgi:hypothetical protein